MHSSELYKTLIEFFRSIPKNHNSLLLAVSGGSDSSALAHLVLENLQRIDIKRVAIAHVNHCLRGEESDGDELFVRQLAQSLECQFFCKRLTDLKPDSSGLEEKARNQRYAFFQSLKNEYRFDYIVTAHTADDQAETVIQRLTRGCGLNGLRAIHQKRDDSVLRPLLSITKKNLLSWLDSNGYSYRTDSSNTDTHFRRNYIRHKVIPLLQNIEPHAVEKIASIASEASRISNIIDQLAAEWLNKNLINKKPDGFELKKSGFFDSLIVSDAIRLIFEQLEVEMTANHINFIISSSGRSGGQFLLPQGWSFYPLRETIRFVKGKLTSTKWAIPLKNPGLTEITEQNLKIIIEKNDCVFSKEESDSVIVDESRIGKDLIYRLVSKDDHFVPSGRSADLSVLHFLAKQGMPKVQRESLGVIADSCNSVIWIPGVRLCECCKIRESTNSAIKITFQPL